MGLTQMRQKTVFLIISGLSASVFLLGQALAQAQGAAAQARPCVPPSQSAAQARDARVPEAAGQGQQGRGPAAEQAARNLTITAIPGVVAAGGKWTKAAGRPFPWRMPKASAHYRWIGRAVSTARTERKGPDRPSRTESRS